jgi:uncharacterized protein
MMIHIFVTNDCNLSCDYCYVSALREKLYFRSESIDPLISFINRALLVNKSEGVILNFFGGEPLLNKRVIEEIIEVSYKINAKTRFMMTTNGTLLTKSNIDYLALHNFILSVSLDGTPEVHNRHRTYANGEPSWEKIMPNLEYLLKEIPGSTARITFNSDNVSELYQSILFLVSQGFREIKPIPNYFDEGWDDEHFSILRDQFERVAKFWEGNINIGISMLNKKLRIQGDCSGGFDSFSINANGDIYPCTYVVGEEKFCLGNITSLENYELQKFPTDHSQRTDCKGCSYFDSCISSRCIFVNYKMTGELCKPSGFFCAYERMQSSYALR